MRNTPKVEALPAFVVLVTLLGFAWFAGRGAVALAAASVSTKRQTNGRGEAAATTRVPGASPPQALARAVLFRNMFDSRSGSLSWEKQLEPPRAAVYPPSFDEGLPPCVGSLRLVASFYVQPRPSASRASIEAEGKVTLYGPGMHVEDHEVVGIRSQRVFMRPSGRPLCQLQMFKAPTVDSIQAGIESNFEPMLCGLPEDALLTTDEMSKGIVRVSDRHYQVARSLLERVLPNPSRMTGARVVPAYQNGRMLGLSVHGIGSTSVLARLGLRDRDRIQAINGSEVTGLDVALEAYLTLRERDQLSLVIVRGGQAHQVTYSIRP